MQPEIANDLILKGAPEVEGYKLLGPCILHSKIGQGGMGAVFRGQHLNLGIEVAVKCLLPGLASLKADLILRFQREAHLAARVTHENLVRVYDVGEQHGLHFLVMEYVTGESLRERIGRRGRSSVREAATVFHQAAKGLAAAHAEGIVHRDIKPENLIVCPSKNLVKVADLGLSRLSESVVDITASQVRMGTPPYMPPEQWRSLGSVGREGDVWALGAVLYYMLAGENAFQGTVFQIERKICEEPFPEIVKLRPDVPQPLVETLRKCTEREPSARYRNARELVEALDRVVAMCSFEMQIDAALKDEPPLSPALLKRNMALPRPPASLIEKVRSGTVPQARIEVAAKSAASEALLLALLCVLLAVVAAVILKWKTAVPGERTPRVIPGFEHAGTNPQGFDEYVHKASQIRMILLPGGAFWMGSRDGGPEKDEKPRHKVTLSPFLIAKYEVSQKEWNDWEDRKSSNPDVPRRSNPVVAQDKSDDKPIYNVTWLACDGFCSELCLSLPTEAQWEFACRSGRSTEFAFGDALTADLANFSGDTGVAAPRPINSYAPNAFGAFNMHGNVREWCQDAYDAGFYGSAAEARNPLCTQGEDKVLRGGCFTQGDQACRSAKRDHELPDRYDQDIGFRPALTLPD